MDHLRRPLHTPPYSRPLNASRQRIADVLPDLPGIGNAYIQRYERGNEPRDDEEEDDENEVGTLP